MAMQYLSTAAIHIYIENDSNLKTKFQGLYKFKLKKILATPRVIELTLLLLNKIFEVRFLPTLKLINILI